jgi:imidazolonepropionase-like amidohydrolase
MTDDETLVHNCTVFDGVADEPIPAAAVLIRGSRIVACGPESAVRPDAGEHCAQIDLGGAFVMAGLLNMHTHFSLALPGDGGDAVNRMSLPQLTLHMADGARRTLLAGVTTVRCVGEADHIEFAIRAAINAGTAIGPRIFTAGRALVCTGGHGHEGASTLECDGADDFRRGARAQISAGADLIKFMISGGIAGEHESIHTPQLTNDEIAAVIDTAHAWGRRVTAHAGPAPIIEQAVRLGLDCVEHGYQLTSHVARLMADRGTVLVPTLVVTRCGDFFDSLGVPEWMQRRSLDAGPRHVESYQLALAAGVEMLLGSDMPPFAEIDGTVATVRELEHMASFGLAPVAALRAATIAPARWLGAGDDIGTVEPGKHADLIGLDDDPTRDVSALRSLRWVMKGGAVVRDDRASQRQSIGVISPDQ